MRGAPRQQASAQTAGEHAASRTVAASSPAMQAFGEHMNKSEAVTQSLQALKSALARTSSALSKVSDAYEAYSELLTDESRPEVSVALKASGKIKDFLGRLSVAVDEANQDMERLLLSEYKALREKVAADTEAALSGVDAAQRTFEAAKKSAATAKKKDMTKQLFEDDAGTRDELAGDAFAKAKRDCAAAFEGACTAAALQNARAFGGLFTTLQRLFGSGEAVVADMEPWDQEIGRHVEALTDAACAQDTWNAQEALSALLDKEEQYNRVLAALADLRKKMLADSSIRFSTVDAKQIFGQIEQLAGVHEDLLGELRAARTSTSVTQSVAVAVNIKLPLLEKLYVPYIEQLGLALQALDRLKKTSGRAAKFLKAWKKRTPSIGAVPCDLPTLMLFPSHHLYKLSNCLRELLRQTDPHDPSWLNLQETLEDLGELLEALDQAKQQSEQMKRLESLNAKLPDEKLVQGNRSFVFDGVLTVLTDTVTDASASAAASAAATAGVSTRIRAGDAAQLPAIASASAAAAAAASAPPPSPPLQQKRQYHLFLFSDILLVAPMPKRGEPQDVYHACFRCNVDALVVSGGGSSGSGSGGRTSFILDSPGRSTLWEAPSAECCEQWAAHLARTIAERAKTVVFGTPLFDIMKRPAERNRRVPSFLQRAVECVEQNGLTTEGVFRLSSDATEFTRICRALDAGRRALFTDPLDAANFIKAWLRSLPEPLLTRALHDTWVSAIERGQPSLAECVQALPDANRNVLEAVVHVLREVADHSAVNKMTSQNLATLVGVGLLDPPSAVFATAGNVAVEMLITHYDEAFAQMKASALAEAAAIDAEARGQQQQQQQQAYANEKRNSVMHIESHNRLRRLATARRSVWMKPAELAAALGGAAGPTTVPPSLAPVLPASPSAAAAAATSSPASSSGSGRNSPRVAMHRPPAQAPIVRPSPVTRRHQAQPPSSPTP